MPRRDEVVHGLKPYHRSREGRLEWENEREKRKSPDRNGAGALGTRT